MENYLPTKEWKEYSYKKIIGPFNKTTAMQVEKFSTDVSTAEDSDTIVSNALKPLGKRKHKPNRKYANSESEVDEDSADENGNRGSSENSENLEDLEKAVINMKKYFENRARTHEKTYDDFMKSALYDDVPNPWQKAVKTTLLYDLYLGSKKLKSLRGLIIYQPRRSLS
ncbi:hypothetical protein TKK_0007956 [Trichogramma kaykai]